LSDKSDKSATGLVKIQTGVDFTTEIGSFSFWVFETKTFLAVLSDMKRSLLAINSPVALYFVAKGTS
jgi:hypothetical protein